ncbi:hypothetical protein D3C81_769890 [compost metagenome]
MRSASARVQRGLLQGLERRQAATQALQLALALLLCLDGLLQLLAQGFQLLDHLLFLQLNLFKHQLAAGHLLTQLQNRGIFRVGAELVALFSQLALALGQTLQRLFELLNTRLLHFGLATWFGRTGVEGVPLFLPAVHGAFGFFQGGRRLFGGGQGHFLLRLEHCQLFAEGRQQGAVMPQVRLGLQARALGFLEVVLELAQTLLAMLDALLDPGDIAADRIEAPLHLPEALGQFMMAITQALDAGIGIALLGHQGLEGHFLVTDHHFALTDLLIQRLPAQGRQLRLELAFLGLVLLVLLGGLGLAMQAFELALQLFAQVGQALKVFMGAADAILGLAPTLLVLGDPGRFFDEVAQVFRLGLDQLGDHPLLDDRIAARAEAGAEEDVGDITAPALGTVEVIGVLPVAGNFTADGDFRVGGVFTDQGAVGVIEHQFDTGLAHRFAAGRAVEDDVGHRLATQVFRRAFAHHPAHRIDDVGLAAAIGADHGRHVAGEVDRGRVDERLEPGQANAL